MLKQLIMALSVLSIHICANENNKEKNIKHFIRDGYTNKDGLTPKNEQVNIYDVNGFSTSSSSFSAVITNIPRYGKVSSRDTQNGENSILRELLKRLYNTTGRQSLPQFIARSIQLPAYFSYLLTPRGCGCNTPPNAKIPAYSTTEKPTPLPEDFTKKPNNETEPDIGNRVGVSKDQENTISDPLDDNDGVRSISFDPVPPKKPLTVPLPPVEHGSVQAGLKPSTVPSTPASKLNSATSK